MDQDKLEELIRNLVALPKETEAVEFKENKINEEDIGQKISALSNSANLYDRKSAYFLGSKTKCITFR